MLNRILYGLAGIAAMGFSSAAAESDGPDCKTAVEKVGAPHLRVETASERCAWTAVLPVGDIAVVDGDGKRLTMAEKELVIDASFSNDGESFAYSTLKPGVRRSVLIVDGKEVTDGKGLNISLHHSRNDRLFWLREDQTPSPRDEIMSVCAMNNSKPVCTEVPYHLSNLVPWGGGFLGLGFDRESFDTVAVSVLWSHREKAPVVRERLRQQETLAEFGGEVYSFGVTGNLHRHVHSYLAAYNTHWGGEPNGKGSNAHGRLTWSHSYRIRHIARLAASTGDAELKAALADMVGPVLDMADANGRYPSDRYGAESETWVVLDGVLYDAMWEAAPHLPKAMRERLTAMTETMLTDAVSDHWTPEGFAWKTQRSRKSAFGPMPFNQQHAPALVMIDWMRATGRNDYAEHVRTLYETFMAEIMDTQAGPAWRYWPLAHFDETYQSPADKGIDLLEDVSHASINAQFAVEAADYLDETLPFDMDEVARNLVVEVEGGQIFHRYLAGQDRKFLPQHSYIPRLALAAQPSLEPTFRRWIYLASGEVGMQPVQSAYSEALPDMKALAGTVTAHRLAQGRDGGIVREKVLDVRIGQEGTNALAGLREVTCTLTHRCDAGSDS